MNKKSKYKFVYIYTFDENFHNKSDGQFLLFKVTRRFLKVDLQSNNIEK